MTADRPDLPVKPHSGLLAGWDLGSALAAGLLAGFVYWRGAAPGVLPGDSGELQFAAWLAGLPHPTGYPLYMLLGWAWSHLLNELAATSPAAAMNLLSAALGGLAVALATLFFVALAETLTEERVAANRWLLRGAALAGALTFAFTPTLWSQALIAEVYTLHAALIAGLLWLALLWRAEVRLCGNSRTSRSGRLLGALALLTGLSLAHHRTTVLLLPVVALFLWSVAGRRYWRLHWRAALAAAALTALPLLLYLYVPLRADHSPWLALPWQPGQALDLLDRSPGGLARYVLGQGFAGELHGLRHALTQAAALPARLSGELTTVGGALAAAGALILAARRRWSVLWLTGAGFLAFAAFNLFYAIGDIAVFYIPAWLIACGWIALAIAWLAEWLKRVLSGRGDGRLARFLPAAVTLACVVLPLFLFSGQAKAADRSRDTTAANSWAALLAANPPVNAVLLSNDRDELMPLWYLQQVDGVRTDLAGVFPLLLPDDGWSNIGRALDSALATGRPVALIKPMSGLEIKARLGETDASGLTPVLGPAVSGEPAVRADAAIGEATRLVGFSADPANPQPGDTLAVDLVWQPQQPQQPPPADYTSFVQLLSAAGDKLAQSDHQPGGVFYPSSLWQPGEMLLDRHELAIPAGAPPGPYRLLVGLYRQTGAGIEPVGQATFDMATSQ